MNTPTVVRDFASIIQTSLAPVFLLAGTAGFVNMFAARLGRVSDRLNDIADRSEQDKISLVQLSYLQRRVLALEIALVLGVSSGFFTGGAILNLLAGALQFGFREENVFWFFGGSIVLLIGSLAAFLVELLFSARNMVRQMKIARATARQD
ncbi:DUF2721 domain-containing protein [Bosea sp. BIWAKO-01]|uniref:DUF2721 domain-containing protein n=1 Tax=Bosea sp. BIWAKO-01 TaxID=506668 RepID=UPI0008539EE2|nr:DUF2721 domain-containing protein [Bosea sp. BIWAKO-01]